MKKKTSSNRFVRWGLWAIAFLPSACTLPPQFVPSAENRNVPATFPAVAQDTLTTAKVAWKKFFTDQNLLVLIDTALRNNQEVNILLQEINITQNEIRARKGEYLPFVSINAGAGVDKVGKYTRSGAVEENLEIAPETKFPEPLPDYMLGAFASWEVDIWSKLHNAKRSSLLRYLATVEGRNFMITQLVSEIANSYYELMALDNQLDILRKNIEIQTNALEIVRLEKKAARVTELAVKKFEAEVLKNQSRQYDIMQQIIEIENRINFLTGRFPHPIQRSSQTFNDLVPDTVYAGIPSQLLYNRPDIRQSELELEAAKVDVKVAKANFYPSIRLTAGVGFQAFNPSYLFTTPQSLIYSLGGELIAPLVNRNAIKANYYSANSRQIQAVYDYQQTILTAYIEVVNQLSNIANLRRSFDLKTKQVAALTESINISTYLFKSARADYMEVLMTQRDALESKFELIDTKKQQMNAMVNFYRALGGGWR
ncbi:TolC family protein [Chryseolinea sp. T2]|uniref:TolC family protein n=1 Tax=Chryseolinea sp. T2 TaxID=3129255 RepID=UPI003077EB9D